MAKQHRTEQQKPPAGSNWARAFAAVDQARRAKEKPDVKQFEKLTKSAGGKS